MKSTIFSAIFLAGFNSIFAQNYDPFIEDLMNQTNLDSLTSYVRILSGEDSVILGDTTVLIEHRVGYTGNDIAADYIKYKLESFGLDTYDQIYSVDGRNIYAIQPGSLFEDQQFIICAHYDAVDYFCADDDASGVAAVLEAARNLSEHQFNYTIIYALWDEEESGAHGSFYYATMADSNDSDIRGVLNLEMFGWDEDNDGLIDIHTRDIANSVPLANFLVVIDSLYSLSLNPIIYNPGTGASDHSSFWYRDYSAVVFSEAYWGGDFNPYYHSSEDRIDKFNLPYFQELTKLAVGSISTLALENLTVSIEDKKQNIPISFNLINFPNPFNNSTTIQYEIPEGDHIVLNIFNNLGQNITKLVNEYQKAGKYEIRFNADNLSSGTYILKISTPSRMRAKKIILLK